MHGRGRLPVPRCRRALATVGALSKKNTPLTSARKSGFLLLPVAKSERQIFYGFPAIPPRHSYQRPLNSGLFGSRERQRVDGSPLAGARGYPANQSLNHLGDWYEFVRSVQRQASLPAGLVAQRNPTGTEVGGYAKPDCGTAENSEALKRNRALVGVVVAMNPAFPTTLGGSPPLALTG